MDGSTWIWMGFAALISSILVLDLGFLGKKNKTPSLRTSLLASASYVLISCLFGGFIYLEMGKISAVNFFTAYALEMSLSFDNIFVIGLIFGALSIPEKYQHRVLFWGILGALVMRGLFIFTGSALIEKFHWILLIFAGFLIVSGIKILMGGADEEEDIQKNKILIFLRRYLSITPTLVEGKFFVKYSHLKPPRYFVTPLFVALVMVEITDLIFAVDSIPATFSVTTDPVLVYTSNILAIMGLRSMFFVLRDLIDKFVFLPKALAVVLVYIGVKVFLSEFSILHIDPILSLGFVLGSLGAAIIASLFSVKLGGKNG